MRGGKACAPISTLLATRSAQHAHRADLTVSISNGVPGGSPISRHHHHYVRRLPRSRGRGPLRDNPLSTVKTFEHIGYGRACAAQVAAEHPRPLSAQLFEVVDRLSPGR